MDSVSRKGGASSASAEILYELMLYSPDVGTRGRGSIPPNHWTDSMKRKGEYHQHQLEIFFTTTLYSPALEPTAGVDVHPIICRIQRTGGSSIIGISWKSFLKPRSTLQMFGRIQRTTRGSIISTLSKCVYTRDFLVP